MVIGDLNLDLWPPNDAYRGNDIKKLLERYTSVMDECSMSQQNFKPTRYRSNVNPSLIDHYFSSHPQKIDRVKTIPCLVADHCIVKAWYHSTALCAQEQFRHVRNWSLVNSDRLMDEIHKSEQLNKVFKLEYPDEVMEIIILK